MMKHIFTLGCCLLFSSAFAETIQNVEYHLPQVAKNWEIGNKLENEKGTTLIYIPQEVKRESATEAFSVNANRLVSNIDDLPAVKTVLSKMYPNMEIDFQVLEKGNDTAIYEWSTKEKGVEKVHGWGRVFANKDGTVVLGYQTENIANIEKARSIWLPVLKEAHSN